MFPITSYTTKQQQQQRLQRPHRYRSCCWFWMSPLLGKDLNKSEHLWDPPSFMLVLLTRLDEPIHLVWYLSLDLPSIVVPTYFSSCGHLNTKASLQSRGSVSLAIIFLYTHYQRLNIFLVPSLTKPVPDALLIRSRRRPSFLPREDPHDLLIFSLKHRNEAPDVSVFRCLCYFHTIHT